MTAEQAKAFGMVDHILGTREGSEKVLADLSSANAPLQTK